LQLLYIFSAEVGQSPTEQQVQDCIDFLISYGGQDDSENGPSESADECDDEHRTDVIQKYDQE
jgi:hypothetical protein